MGGYKSATDGLLHDSLVFLKWIICLCRSGTCESIAAAWVRAFSASKYCSICQRHMRITKLTLADEQLISSDPNFYTR